MYENDNLDSLNEEVTETVSEVIEEPVAIEEPATEQSLEQATEPEPTVQETYEENTKKTDSKAQPWSARDIQPRKKTGWGKRIAVLILCGILLGSTAAGTYISVMYFAGKMGLQPTDKDAAKNNEIIIKDPEIGTVELTQNGEGVVGVVYDVSGVVDSVMPAMVSIVNKYTETVNGFFGQSYKQENTSSGSGIIIGQNDTELLIATNYHVVVGNDNIQITFNDNTTATAYIKGTDPQMDLAVVSVVLDTLSAETKSAIAVASLGNSENLKLGEPVIAIGNALGYGQSVTTGVVSALDREIAVENNESTGSFIQTDAAINPGNSGGALLNMRGQVIGINSNKIGGSAIEGMGYAIPISAAQPIINDLSLQTTKIKVDEAQRGYLGISIQEITASISNMYGMPQGVYVAEVVENGAADTAGIQMRDIVVGLDTFTIRNYADLEEALQYFAAGTTVSVEVMRPSGNAYESVVLEVTLGERPAR